MAHKGLMVGLITGAVLLFSANSKGQDWSFEFEPYILFATTQGETGIGRVTGIEVDVNLGDILEFLDIGFLGHFEAHHNSGWGATFDYGFMNLSSDITGPRGGVLDVKVHQGVLEALLLRRVQSGSGHIDYFAGVRWWETDIGVSIDPAVLPGTAMFENNQDWVDLVIGLRWTSPLSDKWDFHLRGDVGGLGISSDFTSAISTGLRYQINQTIDLDLQYKAAWVDFKSGTPGEPGYFQYDTLTHGPVVGVNFNF